jgi:hypothetical protein
MNGLSFDFNHVVFQRAASFKEVAEFLNTDVSFIEREAHRGKLKVRKFSHRMIRILPHDLIAWLEGATRANPQGRPARAPEPVDA